MPYINAKFEKYIKFEWIGWVELRIFVALTIFQSYCNLEAGDTQSLKFKWQDRDLNPRPLALQAADIINHSTNKASKFG